MAAPPRKEEADPGLTGWENPAQRLRDALDHDHFRLYGQPILPTEGGGRAELVEVLVRLAEEEERLLPPGDFLPAFEHYGMMGELDRWVVRSALRRLETSGRSLPRLSINVSSRTLEEGSFVPFVAVQLRLSGVDPSALVIEIDENDVVERRAACERFAAGVKMLGCSVLLDGFGRRSVSFEPLKALLADYVKVDGTVVRAVAVSASAQAKLKAIARVGQVTGTKVIAECVEEEAVRARLADLGVPLIQGFGVARPEPLDTLLSADEGRAGSEGSAPSVRV
ncbi:MAG: EAL domain-containing protein [Burkholderiales bacterium]|nr:EAL domain-containing protein [Burkholderiales bacterium]